MECDFEVNVFSNGRDRLIKVYGSLGYDASAVLFEIFRRGVKPALYVVDLTNVNAMSSAGLATLIRGYHCLRPNYLVIENEVVYEWRKQYSLGSIPFVQTKEHLEKRLSEERSTVFKNAAAFLRVPLEELVSSTTKKKKRKIKKATRLFHNSSKNLYYTESYINSLI
ncbi:MAG: hypothetical protein QXK37_03595 [Candidatus Woesearchaeota archaeon]